MNYSELCVVAAYFFVGTSKGPSSSGVRLRDERGGASPLRAYRGEGLTLSLPEGHTLRDLRWFSVWCDEYAVSTHMYNLTLTSTRLLCL